MPSAMSLCEVVELLDSVGDIDNGGTGLTGRYRDVNRQGGGDPEDPVEFVAVTSRFYRQLEDYYAKRAWSWVQDARARIDP